MGVRTFAAMMVMMVVMTSTSHFSFFLLSHIILETKFVNYLSYDKTNKSKNSHIERRQCVDFNSHTTNNYGNDNEKNGVLTSWFSCPFDVDCSHKSIIFVVAKLHILSLSYKFSGKRIDRLHSSTRENQLRKTHKKWQNTTENTGRKEKKSIKECAIA